MSAPRARAAPRFTVIGVSGGVGAGKSAVARELARSGFVAFDADTAAKDALDLPEVQAQIRRWWGGEVFTPEGGVDRAGVGAIIFADSAQRKRLEALVHPIVRAQAGQAIDAAKASGAQGLVLDVPLLHESGMDTMCDAIIFVDTPREVRLARVRRARAWDAGELDRREAAQMPLGDKRARATHIVPNDADEAALASRVRAALADITGGSAGRGPSP